MIGALKSIITALLKRYMKKADMKHEAGKTLPRGVVEHADLAYGKANEHRLDVYTPVARTNLPVLVDIHGGALIYGNKELNKRFCYALARLGFAVVSVNYRLVPDVTVPGQLRDVVAALRWTADNVSAYGGNAREGYLCGDSAGAFLALFAAAVCDNKDIAAAFGLSGANFRTHGCFFISGLYDMHLGPTVRFLRSSAFGRGYKKQPWNEYTHLARLLKEWTPPPCFLTSSRGDFLRKQTHALAAALSDLGIPFELDLAGHKSATPQAVHKYSHIYPVKNPEWAECDDLFKRAVRFLFGTESRG